jgi:HNH endonuclease
MSRRRTDICAYCGKHRKITRDHVIPKALFPRPLSAQMVTVSACHDCNSRKSKHDDFLRDLLTTDIAGSQSPIAKSIFQDKVLSSHKQGKSLLSRIARNEAVSIPIVSKSNLYYGDCYTATFDLGRAIEMFSFIVRGLNYKLRGVVMPSDCEFKVNRLVDKDINKWRDFYLKNGDNSFVVHEDIFWCKYQCADFDDNLTFWLLTFYNRIFYRVVTVPVNFDAEA